MGIASTILFCAGLFLLLLSLVSGWRRKKRAIMCSEQRGVTAFHFYTMAKSITNPGAKYGGDYEGAFKELLFRLKEMIDWEAEFQRELKNGESENGDTDEKP